MTFQHFGQSLVFCVIEDGNIVEQIVFRIVIVIDVLKGNVVEIVSQFIDAILLEAKVFVNGLVCIFVVEEWVIEIESKFM